ncbi:MAG: hypothetical protein GY711_09360 [bacterium]|nr:hypothetical protein [bacterium]
MAGSRPREAAPITTGWTDFDAASGGLARGAIHEWIGVEGRGADWSPPLAVLTHLARRSLASSAGHAVWVGRAVWPYPPTLGPGFEVRETRDGLELTRTRAGHEPRPALLERSIFLDVSRASERLWAIDSALRCHSVRAVIGDGSGLDLAATRRLQLAAEAGGGIAWIARPPAEARALSAAATRCIVTRLPSGSLPGWTLRIQRCKSVVSCTAS